MKKKCLSLGSRKSMNPGRDGFTLIELMIVIAIIGILGAIALSIYTPYRKKAKCQQVITSVHDVMTLLIEDVSEDGTAPSPDAGYQTSKTINGVTVTYLPNVQIQLVSGNGTAANPFVVNGRRNPADFTCPDANGIYSLQENQAEGTWQ